MLTELLGRNVGDAVETEAPVLRVDIGLKASLMHGKGIPMPSKPVWGNWAREVVGRLERIEGLLPDGNRPRPIARKLIAQVRGIKAQKVVDLQAWGEAKKRALHVVQQSQPSAEALDKAGPEFALYAYVNKHPISMVELLQDVPELRKYMQKFFEAQEEYMPEGPPMSPLTKSFFYQWALYDVPIGLKRETMGSILLAVGRALKMDPEFLALLKSLAEGRMGLYLHEGSGTKNETIVLKELLTEVRHEAVCSSGYFGTKGELWLARVMPPPAGVAGTGGGRDHPVPGSQSRS